MGWVGGELCYIGIVSAYTQPHTCTEHMHLVASVASSRRSPQSHCFKLCWEHGWPVHMLNEPPHLLHLPGGCGSDEESWTCLFISPLYRGLVQETRFATHPTGCFVPSDSQIPICQPLTHTQTKSVLVVAVCQAQKKYLEWLDLLGSKLEQRIMGVVTPLAF